ncbi:Cof-type HAD-IIB family hydrolase [Bacillus sp. ISL-51]|uniref:Cof-type HAD-IIB family hydrolase n=1 Tax=Bacteria TaxID=2 RepID=UPI001BEC180A|nr:MULTISPECIES: Cof-type HAD-IIB family hydrolase [Bacteria]MBT2573525.1 Cof-type HAD-IIB family hydrolase [Bacillus sp. ISL-51]MBT2633789.1 Cof-type HAD-IIB family hydrolase [Bacillus sp. ISL-26]MBT2712621.1 Cof-type HAD-IIB family hydrolase [Pseudomonas sp. ISL-88]MBY8912360.1 Cof-type HAD-IIB family hydrolase [Bacillus sp. YC2]
MKPKLIFFDIDGTIYDHDKHIPESTRKTVAALKDAGHHVFIASGRSPFLVKPILEELDIQSFISYNGQFVVFEGDVIYKNPLPEDAIERLLQQAAEGEHPVVFMAEDTMKTTIAGHPHVSEGIGTLKAPYPEVDEQFYKGKEIYQLLLFCRGHEEKAYAAFPEFDYVRWHELSTDVLPSGGSKAEGIKRVLERLPYEISDTYAFGDGLNDLEMIGFVGTGVAMGNAVPELKEAADFVTKPVDEEGISYAVKELGLLK